MAKAKKSKQLVKSVNKPGATSAKLYSVKNISTSITLLSSPELDIVIEALIFLSRYIDLQPSNLNSVPTLELLPNLLKLLDRDLSILRPTFKLLSKLLKTEAARLEIQRSVHDAAVLKICNLFVDQKDVVVEESASVILAIYSSGSKKELLLSNAGMVSSMLNAIKCPETEIILQSSLGMFNELLGVASFRENLRTLQNFDLEMFITQMSQSDTVFAIILDIFENLAFVSNDDLQEKLQKHVTNIIINQETYALRCLNILLRSVNSTGFVKSLEFLEFCHWVKACRPAFMLHSAQILLKLSKIDEIRQLLYDLSVENSILSLFRSDCKEVLNAACRAISFMTAHKYCCRKLVCALVVGNLCKIMNRKSDESDSQNEIALETLYILCKKDPRTIYVIYSCKEIGLIRRYIGKGTNKLSKCSYIKVLEIVAMFVTNNQLQSVLLSQELYDVILKQAQSKFDEVIKCCLKILLHCLNNEEFRSYVVNDRNIEVFTKKLSQTQVDPDLFQYLLAFINNALKFPNVARHLIKNKCYSLLKSLNDNSPLLKLSLNFICSLNPSIKFFETWRLDYADRIKNAFYLIRDSSPKCIDFLETLNFQNIPAYSTIYVVDYSEKKLHFWSQTIQNKLTNCSNIRNKIKTLAQFVDSRLNPRSSVATSNNFHDFHFYLETIKNNLNTNLIPLADLSLGFQCEKALLFKALADCVGIPSSFVRNKLKIYWNEVELPETHNDVNILKVFIVDLMDCIGELIPIGSKKSNANCGVRSEKMCEAVNALQKQYCNCTPLKAKFKLKEL